MRTLTNSCAEPNNVKQEVCCDTKALTCGVSTNDMSALGAKTFNTVFVQRLIDDWIDRKKRTLPKKSGKVPGMAVWRERLFAAMHLNANLPAAYFGVPTSQVVEVGLEVEI